MCVIALVYGRFSPWRFWSVAGLVCGSFGLWQFWSVAVLDCLILFMAILVLVIVFVAVLVCDTFRLLVTPFTAKLPWFF